MIIHDSGKTPCLSVVLGGSSRSIGTNRRHSYPPVNPLGDAPLQWVIPWSQQSKNIGICVQLASMDWFKGKFTPESPIFNGGNPWFPAKFPQQTNPMIAWCILVLYPWINIMVCWSHSPNVQNSTHGGSTSHLCYFGNNRRKGHFGDDSLTDYHSSDITCRS